MDERPAQIGGTQDQGRIRQWWEKHSRNDRNLYWPPTVLLCAGALAGVLITTLSIPHDDEQWVEAGSLTLTLAAFTLAMLTIAISHRPNSELTELTKAVAALSARISSTASSDDLPDEANHHESERCCDAHHPHMSCERRLCHERKSAGDSSGSSPQHDRVTPARLGLACCVCGTLGAALGAVAVAAAGQRRRCR
jgi:hypothetical protein